MANTELNTVLSSGDITNIQIGSTASGDRAVKASELVASSISFDDTGTGVTASELQVAVATLSNTGLMVMSGNGLAPQTINTSATKLNLFDTKNTEAGVGAIGDVSLNRATATLDGVFKIRFEAFVSYASNIDITYSMYKNGVPFGNTITLAGQGNKVFPIVLITSSDLLANDYLELHATASSSTQITISQANGTLEKTIF